MDVLLDTSWTLHQVTTPATSTAYTTLFTPATTQDHLTRYFAHLPSFLTSQISGSSLTDDFNNGPTGAPLGPLRSFRPSLTTLPSSPTHAIHLALSYTNTPQPLLFVLHTPHLILSKAPAPHTRALTAFLSETFSVTPSPLRLSPSFLTGTLDTYVITLAAPTSDRSIIIDEHGDGAVARERRAARLRALAGLKLTVSCAGDVAPHLRTVDVAVPLETVGTLVDQAAGRGYAGFSGEVAGYVHAHTGVRLPLGRVGGGERGVVDADDADDDGDDDDDDDEENTGASGGGDDGATLRLAKIVCAGFAIGADGKLKFARRAVEGVGGVDEDIVVAADMGVLERVVGEARRMQRRTGR